jgi:AraC-like DNA-binding protein
MLYDEVGEAWMSRIYVAHRPALGDQDPDLWLSLMGRFTSTGHFRYDQVSPCIAVHVVRSGSGLIRTDTTEYRVGPGDVFTFFPGTRYRYADRPASPWRYTWCVLDGPSAQAALATVGIDEASPHLTGCPVAALERLFTETEQAYPAATNPPLYPVAAAWRLLDLLSRTATDERSPADGQVVAAARTLMELRFMTGLTVGDIARQLGVDRSTLFRGFHREYGVSPKQHLDTVRLRHARTLLRAGTSVADTAGLCGFADSHYFSRAYRKTYGHPPSAEVADGEG